METAEKLKPVLIHQEVVNPDILGNVYDFGNHYTGYFSFRISTRGHHPDAPGYLRLTFAEVPGELDENPEDYKGWISKGWIQTEYLHIDEFPAEIVLPRRYAFRYVKIEQLAHSDRYELVFSDLKIDAVSAADDRMLSSSSWSSFAEDERKEIEKIDRIAVRTLHECMQDVFEDGPKRDRRLWMGDLRLEALADYQTYRNNDLVRRCLYLFAGTLLPDRHVASNVFCRPVPEADDASMFDYSLFFIPALRDYFLETGDTETLSDLYPIAVDQVRLAEKQMTGGIVNDSSELGWCFIDWNLDLNKQTAAQGVYLYCLQALVTLARKSGDSQHAAEFEEKLNISRKAAMAAFYDPGKRLFVSGQGRQVSWAGQIWMVLGGVVTGEEAAELLKRVSAEADAVSIVTPYLYHSLVEAWDTCGKREEAKNVLLSYWGGMAQSADTFWELYNPADPEESPYGGKIVNSWCHAWSCAPAYFLRKWEKEG